MPLVSTGVWFDSDQGHAERAPRSIVRKKDSLAPHLLSTTSASFADSFAETPLVSRKPGRDTFAVAPITQWAGVSQRTDWSIEPERVRRQSRSREPFQDAIAAWLAYLDAPPFGAQAYAERSIGALIPKHPEGRAMSASWAWEGGLPPLPLSWAESAVQPTERAAKRAAAFESVAPLLVPLDLPTITVSEIVVCAVGETRREIRRLRCSDATTQAPTEWAALAGASDAPILPIAESRRIVPLAQRADEVSEPMAAWYANVRVSFAMPSVCDEIPRRPLRPSQPLQGGDFAATARLADFLHVGLIVGSLWNAEEASRLLRPSVPQEESAAYLDWYAELLSVALVSAGLWALVETPRRREVKQKPSESHAPTDWYATEQATNALALLRWDAAEERKVAARPREDASEAGALVVGLPMDSPWVPGDTGRDEVAKRFLASQEEFAFAQPIPVGLIAVAAPYSVVAAQTFVGGAVDGIAETT